MNQSPYQIDKRLGVKVPRTILLPPYLLDDYYVQYMQGIDATFGPLVDDKINVIKQIRNMWVSNPTVEQAAMDGAVVPFDMWSQPEREILVKQVNMLGMKLKSAGVLTDNDYQRVARFLGQYWFEKGTYSFIEFINFCLSSDLEIKQLWSEDLHNGDYEYHNFTAVDTDGAPPGVPVWQGGNWFPTSHVQIEANGGLGDLDVETLSEFFYEIANYNLVLYAVDIVFRMDVIDTLGKTNGEAEIVALGLWANNVVVMSTEGRYGTDAPPTTTGLQQMPTKVMVVSGADASGFLMMDPASWFLDSSGRKLAAYSITPDKYSNINLSVSASTTLPDATVGQAITDMSQAVVLCRPAGWAALPGASMSQARVPVWTAVPTLIVDNQSTSAQHIGQGNYFVVNPTGWLEITAGQFTPYW